MYKKVFLIGILLCHWLSLSVLASGLPDALPDQPMPSLAPMLERVVPAVVNISTRASVVENVSPLFEDPFFRRFFALPPATQRQRQRQGLGSGVIVDSGQGWVLTNNHVIARAEEISVTLHDGRRFDAEVLGADPETDIALLRIPAEHLHALPFADSDRLRVGDFVVAIGNPFGLGQTVTGGMISALGRSGLGIDGFEDFIQTDASINPGNSGGALVNLRGELVGINTAILARGGGNIGIGFAIPINIARMVQELLLRDGVVSRGQLGIGMQDLTPELATAFALPTRQGAVVARVNNNSPAQRAGLRPGDVILMVNGRSVRNAADLRNQLGLLRADSAVELQVLRNGQTLQVFTRVESPRVSEVDAGVLDRRLVGVRLQPISPRNGETRLQVSDIAPASAGARSGLRTGDILLAVNRREVSDLPSLREALDGSRSTLSLNIQRGNSLFLILLQ